MAPFFMGYTPYYTPKYTPIFFIAILWRYYGDTMAIVSCTTLCLQLVSYKRHKTFTYLCCQPLTLVGECVVFIGVVA